jgi:thymidylate synthase (FAD)
LVADFLDFGNPFRHHYFFCSDRRNRVKIVQPSVSLHTPFGVLTEFQGIEMLRWIEFNARISHRSEEAQTEDSWQRFIKAVVLEHGDWSVTEHASLTAILRVDRGVTHELVRHRLFSYTQESTRFVNYGKREMEFIEPSWSARKGDHNPLLHPWQTHCESAEIVYEHMLTLGASPQVARSVLPNSLAATISVTGNLRNWRHLFLMRTSKETHPDFRRVTIPMLAEFKKKIPLLYDDVEPEARQIDNLKKAR